MENEFRLQLLFNKYRQQQCTPEEIEELIALIQQADADEILDEQMQLLWKQLQEDTRQHPADWDKMYSLITTADDETLSVLTKQKKPAYKFWYGVAAASILFLSSIALYIYKNKAERNDTNRAIVNTVKPGQSISNKPKQTIHLPDGSTVILNAGSKLDYPSAFNGTSREVYLTGEAYFDIKHDPLHPFYVHTEKITTKVLGTAFDIKAYPDDATIEVTVTRGKVQVLKENKSIGVITASQQLTFSKKNEDYSQRKIDTNPILAWKPKEIFLDDITMQEAAGKFKELYGMEVSFINPGISNCRITATFSEDDMPDEILTVICGVIKATYHIQNNKIFIDGAGCN